MTRKASCNCGKLSVTYEGPDPDRISLCQCNDCQRRTGSVLSAQARLPVEHVTAEGKSKTWTVPADSGKPASRCDSMGATYHFCPECGSTLYWEIDGSPDLLGVAVGAFTDPTFPPPMISGFEAYGRPWVMNISDLSMPHFEHDGSSHGGSRA
jgi:hypothetical protein